MTREELDEVLQAHAEWRKDDTKGKRANLRNANLQDADLRNANLQDADLRNANLQYANLRNANLQDANLRNANLQKADLRNADLWNANLRNANLDFSVWPLHCGSLDVKCDLRLVAQLAYHLARLKPEGVVGWDELRTALKPIANKFHRTELPRIA